MKHDKVLLTHAAYGWDNATPVGCGSLGAMWYGKVDEDRLVLNEEHIWNGDKKPVPDTDFRERLDAMRERLLRGENEAVDRWMVKGFDDCFGRVKSYEYAGELTVRLHGSDVCSGYRRELNLSEGVASVAYKKDRNPSALQASAERKKDRNAFERQLFASYPKRLLAYRFDADGAFSVSYRRENVKSLRVDGDKLIAVCATADGGHPFCVAAQVATDGTLSAKDGALVAEGASCGEVYVSVVSSFEAEAFEAEALRRLDGCEAGWDALLREHTADFSDLMERCEIDLGDDALDGMPVDERLLRLKLDNGARDDALLSLYFQFGRYLLASSSRPGTLPANLQGLWCAGVNEPWNADYHTNINLQMNYWPAEAAALPECCDALFDYMNKTLLPSGRETASKLYRMRGMVLHHLSDLYGYTMPADGIWGMWPLGGAWLCFHMWEHYLYSGDEAFLRDTAYEFVRENALFFLDNLFEGKDGTLLSGPSASPENRYFVNGEGSYAASVSLSPTMDVEIIGGLLRIYAEMERLLGADPEAGRQAEAASKRLPPLRVGKHGQLMEWQEDYDEPEPGHRHISHGFALYPDCAITRERPELMDAVRTTLSRRLSHGGGHTGWSRAWLISMFARLRDGAAAFENAMALLRKSTLGNLFDTHPPFQIDGNFGGAAGIAEMAMQSHEGWISLLPAMDAFPNGSFRGLRARGGYAVSATWRGGRVIGLSIEAKRAGTVEVELPDGQAEGRPRLELHAGVNEFTFSEVVR